MSVFKFYFQTLLLPTKMFGKYLFFFPLFYTLKQNRWQHICFNLKGGDKKWNEN